MITFIKKKPHLYFLPHHKINRFTLYCVPKFKVVKGPLHITPLIPFVFWWPGPGAPRVTHGMCPPPPFLWGGGGGGGVTWMHLRLCTPINNSWTSQGYFKALTRCNTKTVAMVMFSLWLIICESYRLRQLLPLAIGQRSAIDQYIHTGRYRRTCR